MSVLLYVSTLLHVVTRHRFVVVFLGPFDEVELLLALGLLQVLLWLSAMGLGSGVLLGVDVDCVLVVFLTRKRGLVAVDFACLLLDGIGILNLQAFILFGAFRFD